MENLRHLPAAPSVQMQSIPEDSTKIIENEETAKDLANPDIRLHRKLLVILLVFAFFFLFVKFLNAVKLIFDNF